MIEQKKTSELIETSLICLLSAGVAIGAFLLMWLLAVLTRLNRRLLTTRKRLVNRLALLRKNFGPDSVMYRQSSSRIPNSP